MTVRRLVTFAFVLLGAAGVAVPTAAAKPRSTPAPSVALHSCSSARSVRPTSFVISCADGNAALTKTTWRSWTAKDASGTTTFALNLCNPYCAASKISYFPESAVVLSTPMTSKKHGALFSKLVVTYTLKGKLQIFTMSWKGTPAFS